MLGEEIPYALLPSASCVDVNSGEFLLARASRRMAEVYLRLQQTVLDWWNYTSSTGYKCSGYSRRKYWHITLPIVFLTNLLTDTVFNNGVVLIGTNLCTLVVVFAATWFLPVSSLLGDAVIVTMVSVYYLVNSAVISDANGIEIAGVSGDEAYSLFVFYIAYLLAFCAMCGVQSWAIGICCLLALGFTLLVDVQNFFYLLAVSVSFFVGAVCIEHQLASAYLTHHGLQKMVEDSSDGSFSINLANGMVCSASTKMNELFGEQVATVRFADMLEPSDVPRFEDFVQSGAEGKFGAMLVFFQMRGACKKSFDCKLTSFMNAWKRLDICLHLVGEVREQIPARVTTSLREVCTTSYAELEQYSCAHVECTEEQSKKEGLGLASMHNLDFAGSTQEQPIGLPALEVSDQLSQHSGQESSLDYSMTLASEAPAKIETADSRSSCAFRTSTCKRRFTTDAAVQTEPAPTTTVAVQASAQMPTDLARPPLLPVLAGTRPESVKSDGACSHNSSHRLKAPPGAVGIVSVFKVMPPDCMRNMLEDMILRWNCPRLVACCPRHTALLVMKHIVKAAMKTKCQPLWSPYVGWQCKSCFSLNQPDEEMCATCFEDPPDEMPLQFEASDLSSEHNSDKEPSEDQTSEKLAEDHLKLQFQRSGESSQQ